MNNQQQSEIEKKILSLCERSYAKLGSLPVIEKEDKDGNILPHWAAWREWRIRQGLSVLFMDSRTRWTVPSEYPPVNLDMALVSTQPAKLSQKLAS